MALIPLARAQVATVPALVESRLIDTVPVDQARAASLLGQAEDRLSLMGA